MYTVVVGPWLSLHVVCCPICSPWVVVLLSPVLLLLVLPLLSTVVITAVTRVVVQVFCKSAYFPLRQRRRGYNRHHFTTLKCSSLTTLQLLTAFQAPVLTLRAIVHREDPRKAALPGHGQADGPASPAEELHAPAQHDGQGTMTTIYNSCLLAGLLE